MSTLGDEIAVEVMGWTKHNRGTSGMEHLYRSQWHDSAGFPIWEESWDPLEDERDAIRAIEKATKKGQWTSRRLPDGSYIVGGMSENVPYKDSIQIHAPTFAEAVSRLALAVVRRGKEQG